MDNLVEFVQCITVFSGFVWLAFYRSMNFTPVGESEGKIFYWWMAIGWACIAVIRMAHGHSFVVDAFFVAYNLFRWWLHGGDKGTKNFLQNLAPKPAHAVR